MALPAFPDDEGDDGEELVPLPFMSDVTSSDCFCLTDRRFPIIDWWLDGWLVLLRRWLTGGLLRSQAREIGGAARGRFMS